MDKCKSINANALNCLTESHRMAEWIKNPDPAVCCLLYAALFRFKDTGRLKVKEWKTFQGSATPRVASGASGLWGFGLPCLRPVLQLIVNCRQLTDVGILSYPQRSSYLPSTPGGKIQIFLHLHMHFNTPYL